MRRSNRGGCRICPTGWLSCGGTHPSFAPLQFFIDHPHTNACHFPFLFLCYPGTNASFFVVLPGQLVQFFFWVVIERLQTPQTTGGPFGVVTVSVPFPTRATSLCVVPLCRPPASTLSRITECCECVMGIRGRSAGVVHRRWTSRLANHCHLFPPCVRLILVIPDSGFLPK